VNHPALVNHKQSPPHACGMGVLPHIEQNVWPTWRHVRKNRVAKQSGKVPVSGSWVRG